MKRAICAKEHKEQESKKRKKKRGGIWGNNKTNTFGIDFSEQN